MRMNFMRRLQTFLPEAGGDRAGLSCHIWDHDSDGTGSREDDCSEDELYEKIADLPPRGWW